MSVHATLYSGDRGAERLAFDRSSTLRTEGDTPVDVLIENVSLTGFRLRAPAMLATHQDIRVGMPGIGIRSAHVIWTDQGTVGCMFDRPLGQPELDTVMAFDSAVVAELPELSARRRLAIIIASAIGAWLLCIALVGLVRLIVG